MKLRLLSTLAAAALAVVLSVQPGISQSNPLAMKQLENAPDEILAMVEIPAGSFTKYETDIDTGQIFVDRFVSMPMVYPTNYGSIVSTKAGDGDPLDVLVFTREPVYPGALIKVRPIGVINMVDGGDVDAKIIAVPVTKVDPTYEGIKSVDDLPAMERERLLAFFRVYKQIPEGSKVIELKGFEGVEPAKAAVKEALDAYGK